MSEFTQIVKDGLRKIVEVVKRFFLIILTIAVLGFIAFVWISGWTYSEGTRAGHLIKISRKGVVFKTYEGQLNLGGFQSDPQTGVAGNIWEFSVRNSDIYEELQNHEGKQVTLFYRQRYRSFAWQGKTEYFVYRVEQVK